MDAPGVPLETPLSTKDVTVLSPHSDDAALSISGLLHLAANRGHVCTIITVFSRSRRTRTGGIEPDAERVTSMRKSEDETFVRMLGCDARALWCDLPDPSVRLPETRETWYVPRPLSEEESGFVSLIVSFCEEHVPAEGTMLAPMALGGNRDHLIARDAALEFVHRTPCRLFLYEDLPYAARITQQELERDARALADERALTLTPHRISYAALLLRKRKAVAVYASQVNRDITGHVLRHAVRVGKVASAAERLWEVGFATSSGTGSPDATR